ncbi:MAG: GlgB N-terminal domain-containing protein, partial [Nitrospiraceae bacterium]
MRPSEDIERLVRAEHWDPFCVLGPHSVTANGQRATVVRAFLPEAVAACLLPDERGTTPVPMTSIHAAGLFEASVPAMGEKPRYRLRVTDRRGGVTERHDPYAYPPLLSDLDLHLFAEGRLYRAYEILGAHLHTVDDVAGVRFVVWAPNALRVSVVGDFNGWDGRRHPMRSRGGTGLWELFIPETPEGSNYKYEIRPQDHDAPLLKA